MPVAVAGVFCSVLPAGAAWYCCKRRRLMRNDFEVRQNTAVCLTVNRECCLSGAPPALLAAIRTALTIDNPKYEATKR